MPIAFVRDFFTINETAERLGLSRQSVVRAIRSGSLQANRLGRRAYRIPVSAIDAWLAATTVEPDAASAATPRPKPAAYDGPRRLDW